MDYMRPITHEDRLLAVLIIYLYQPSLAPRKELRRLARVADQNSSPIATTHWEQFLPILLRVIERLRSGRPLTDVHLKTWTDLHQYVGERKFPSHLFSNAQRVNLHVRYQLMRFAQKDLRGECPVLACD